MAVSQFQATQCVVKKSNRQDKDLIMAMALFVDPDGAVQVLVVK
jgi:hypothetical protein